MDSEKGMKQKVCGEEVVVSIMDIEKTSKTNNKIGESSGFSKNTQIASPNVELNELKNQISPEITKTNSENITRVTINKPSKIPEETVLDRPLLMRSKPKSRLVEPKPPIQNNARSDSGKFVNLPSPKAKSASKGNLKTVEITMKAALVAQERKNDEDEDDEDEDEEDDGDVYQKAQLKVGKKSGPPTIEYSEIVGKTTRMLSLSYLKGGKKVEREEVDMEKLHKMEQEKISAWTIWGLIKVIQDSGLSTVSNTLDISVSGDGTERKYQKITTTWEAKTAAQRIFKNVARRSRNYIDEEDLLLFMKKEDVDRVLPAFNGAVETRKIKKASIRNWVVNVYKERKLLTHSLDDTKTAIEELNRILSGVALVVIIIVWLLLMGIATTKLLVFISSQLLLVAFIFGNTCKNIFESLIFVFIMHPFDIGDRCIVDGVQMIVEEMNILTTVFLRYDKEMIFYPNSVLATKPISNFFRSPEMGDAVEFAIDVATSVETIASLKAKIKLYIDRKPKHWFPDHSVQIMEIENVNNMKLGLYVNHTINFQDFGEKMTRKTELVLEIKKIFEELGIKFRLIPQEVHLRNVGSQAPTNSDLMF